MSTKLTEKKELESVCNALLKYSDSILMHRCSGKLTIKMKNSMFLCSFSRCWFVINTRDFLIVLISDVLFAKCLVFAVQMTFASHYFVWNTLCINCKKPYTIQKSFTVFLQCGYYTYVPKGGKKP